MNSIRIGKTAGLAFCLLLLGQAGLDAVQQICTFIEPPILVKRATNTYRYSINSAFVNDGAQFGQPSFNSADCIAAGLVKWNNRAGVTVGPPPPSANLTVVTYTPPGAYTLPGETTPPGHVFGARADVGGYTIRVAWDIARASEFNCGRIRKLLTHEMGHIIGLGHVVPDGQQIMNEYNSALPFGGIDALMDDPSCAEEAAGVRAQYFEAPGPPGYSNIGGIAQCGPNEWSDEHGCCHGTPQLFAPAVGHINHKPISHIRFPANNSAFLAGASITFSLHTLDLDGSVVRVDYIVKPLGGTQFTVSGGGYPYHLTVSSLPAGTYDVEAVAYDTADQYTVSDAKRITVSPLPGAAQVLASGAALYANQSRVSANGQYALIYQADGNLVLYGPSGAIVATMTFGAPGGAYMNPSGNLEVYNAGPTLVWQSLTGVAGNAGAYLWVTDIGKIALVRPNGTLVAQWP